MRPLGRSNETVPLGAAFSYGTPAKTMSETSPQPDHGTPAERSLAGAPRHNHSLRWLHNGLGAAVTAAFGGYLWVQRDSLLATVNASAVDVLVLAVLILLTWGAGALQSVVIYRAADLPVRVGEMWLLTMATNFGNHLPMRLGTVVRAHYLKSVYGFRYARFGSTFGVRVVLTVFATGLMGLVGVVASSWVTGHTSHELLTLFGGLTVAPAIAWLVPMPRKRDGAGRLRRILYDFFDGVTNLRAQPRMTLLVLLGVLLQHSIVGVRFFVAADVMGAKPTALLILLLAPLANLVSFIAITPGALGIREALMGYVTLALGTSFSHGAYMGTVDRAVLLGVVTIAGGASFLVVWRRARRQRRSPGALSNDIVITDPRG